MLVPPGANPRVEAPMAGHIDGGRDLGVEGGVAVAVAAHHLTDVDVLGVPRQAGRNRPALEGGFHGGFGNRVEMVEDPNRVPPTLVGLARDVGHRLVFLDGIIELDEVHPPALRNEHSEFGRH